MANQDGVVVRCTKTTSLYLSAAHARQLLGSSAVRTVQLRARGRLYDVNLLRMVSGGLQLSAGLCKVQDRLGLEVSCWPAGNSSRPGACNLARLPTDVASLPCCLGLQNPAALLWLLATACGAEAAM